MAKEQDAPGSDKAELKRMLKMASDRSIHMAFALGKDGAAVVKMDKMKNPAALGKALKGDLPDGKNHRFGTVSLDPNDATTAIFMVNKAVGGIARKLIVALKGTGVSKVQVVMEDGSAVEDASEGAEDDEAGAPDAFGQDAFGQGAFDIEAAPDGDTPDPAPGDTPGDGTNPSYAEAQPPATDPATADVTFSDPVISPLPMGAVPDDGKGGAAGDPPVDPAAQMAQLTRDLTGLVKMMMAVIAKDPSRKADLGQTATAAQASIKKGDIENATTYINILRDEIQYANEAAAAASPDGADPAGLDPAGTDPADTGSAGAQPTATAASGPAVAPASAPASAPAATATPAQPATPAAPDPATTQRLQKSHAAWTATRAKVDGEMQKLIKAILSASDGDDEIEGFEEEFQSVVEPVLTTLDASLSDTLSRAAQASDAGEREELLTEARATLARYTKFVQSSPIIAHLDGNPFVPLAIGKTLTSTLSTLSSIIQ